MESKSRPLYLVFMFCKSAKYMVEFVGGIFKI